FETGKEGAADALPARVGPDGEGHQLRLRPGDATEREAARQGDENRGGEGEKGRELLLRPRARGSGETLMVDRGEHRGVDGGHAGSSMMRGGGSDTGAA